MHILNTIHHFYYIKNKLNLKNLVQDQDIDLKVLRKFKNYETNFQLLGYSCFNYIAGLTSIRTIEILLKFAMDFNSDGSGFDLLSDIFDVEIEEYNVSGCFEEKYKIIGDLLFKNGYNPNYDIFLYRRLFG